MEREKTNLYNNNVVSDNVKITKVGHLYENIKFDCNDNVEKIEEDFCYGYFDIIGNAQYGNFDMLNELINNTFNDDIKILENKLRNSTNITTENKKKFFFDVESNKIFDDFKTYIKFIYAQRIVFDILNVGLKDLENKNIKEILKSKQQNRIDNFIDSIKNESVMDNNLKLNYAEQIEDRKNYFRYVIYFYYLKKSLMHIEEETKQLEKYNKLKRLDEQIEDLDNKIKSKQQELSNPNCHMKKINEKMQEKHQEKIKKLRDQWVCIEKELQQPKNMNFILKEYGNELKLAQNILEDIQSSWKSAFESFIFHYMIKYPNTISQLR